MKNHREIKGPRKANINAIIEKKPQKIWAPDSQTWLATCRTKKINRAHRSHSTRGQAKCNKQEESRITNQDNKIARFYPCTPTMPGCHRRVCTGPAIPYTYLQMCGELKMTTHLYLCAPFHHKQDTLSPTPYYARIFHAMPKKIKNTKSKISGKGAMEEREHGIWSGTYLATRSSISLQLSSVAVVSPACTTLLRLFSWVFPPPRSSRILHGAAFAVSFGRTPSAGLLFFLVPGGYDFFPLPATLPCATAPYRPSSLHESIRLC